jgi:Cu/Ag efflux pump CusA
MITQPRRRRILGFLTPLAAVGLPTGLAAAEKLTVAQLLVSDEKSVFATVESISVVPARGRIGVTVVQLKVREGDRVAAGQAHPTLLWDGEWEITYVTFRDMGAAFGAAILGIYLLVVAQFKSFRLPLIIIPLTLIGILIGHWLLGAPFTAISTIGFIALTGLIVQQLDPAGRFHPP